MVMEEKRTFEELLKEIEKLNEEMKRVREDIDHSYYSIPKKEFENITIQKITNEATEQINKRFDSKVASWRNVLLIVLPILALFGFTGLSSTWSSMEAELRNKLFDRVKVDSERIDIENKKAKEELERKINDALAQLKEYQKNEKASLSESLTSFKNTIDEKAKSAAKKETEAQIEPVKKDIDLALKASLRTELNALRSDVDQKRVNYDMAVVRLNPLLDKAKKLEDGDLVAECLDELFRLKFLLRKYEELDALRVQYENEYDFKPTTWGNVTIADMYLYSESPIPINKKKALEAYEKALKSLPNYGEPHAVRLIIHMIDYSIGKDQKTHEKELADAGDLLSRINSGSAYVTSYEAYTYLLKIEKYEPLAPYVEALFANFPEEMNTMHARAVAYTKLLEQYQQKTNINR